MNVYLGVYLVGYDSFPLGNMSWLTQQCSIGDDDEDDGGGGDGDGDGDGDEENYCDVDEEGDGKEGF